jgi:hypothetical protein
MTAGLAAPTEAHATRAMAMQDLRAAGLKRAVPQSTTVESMKATATTTCVHYMDVYFCFINVMVLSHIQGFRSGDHPRQGGYNGENTYGSGPRRENSPGRSYGGNELGRREDRGHDSHGIGRRNEEDTYGHQQQPYREGGSSYDGRPNEESYGGRNSEGSSGPYRRNDGSSYGRSRYENNERNESNQYRQQGQHTGTGGGAYGSSGYGNRNDSERRGEEGRKTTSETHTSTSNAEPVSSISCASSAT